MESDPKYWFPDSPWCNPAHRWLRACWLVDRGKRSKPGIDDDGVRRALRFLRAGGNVATGPLSTKAERADPPLAEAFRLYREEPANHRWKLEAYLLTEEPIESVADRCSMPPATVQTYHDTFFDVREFFAASDWIWLRAIRGGSWNGFSVDFPGSLFKGIAYSAGVRLLEVVIAVMTNAPFPEWLSPSFGNDPLFEEARLRLIAKLCIAALRAQSTAELEAIADAREQLRSLERKALGKVDKPDGLLPAMESFLQSVSGRKKSRRRKPAERVERHKRSAEASGVANAERHVSIAQLLKELK